MDFAHVPKCTANSWKGHLFSVCFFRPFPGTQGDEVALVSLHSEFSLGDNHNEAQCSLSAGSGKISWRREELARLIAILCSWQHHSANSAIEFWGQEWICWGYSVSEQGSQDLTPRRKMVGPQNTQALPLVWYRQADRHQSSRNVPGGWPKAGRQWGRGSEARPVVSWAWYEPWNRD